LTGKVGSEYLLDTVIVVRYFAGDADITKRLTGITHYIATNTVAELYYGAYKSQLVAQNLQNIHKFLQSVKILPCIERTADQYGQIKAALKAKGRPIPENDMWIAAAALEHGLILATRDAHFQEIDRLSVETW
jgi:tRNA(fMet)-specific endonuclease VapC